MYLFGDPNLGKDNNMPFILSPHFRDLDVDQDYYLHNLYQLFKAQLVEANLIWPSNNKPVVLRRLPEVHNFTEHFGILYPVVMEKLKHEQLTLKDAADFIGSGKHMKSLKIIIQIP